MKGYKYIKYYLGSLSQKKTDYCKKAIIMLVLTNNELLYKIKTKG